EALAVAFPDDAPVLADADEDADADGVAGDAVADFPPTVAPDVRMPDRPLAADEDMARQEHWIAAREALRDTVVGMAITGFEPYADAYEGASREYSGAVGVQARDVRAAMGSFEATDRTAASASASARAAVVRLAVEFDVLRRLSSVQDVRIEPEMLTVQTRDLLITEDDTTYNIGAWDIQIPRKGIDVKVMSRPYRQGYQGWQHPHVDAGGKLCWGNVRADLERAITDGQYDVAATYLILLLQTGRGRKEDWTFHMSVLQSIGQRVTGGAHG
ncbi:MAG: hypothetical protein Q8R16_01190, partial [bacterium]|nr:hypothetical protein [bacterium]